MTSSSEDIAHWRELTRVDWVHTAQGDRLHHATLTDTQTADFEDEGSVIGPIRLACGRIAARLYIPGVFTRLGMPRCTGCCRVTGLPPGLGSPKNDPACRALLGLP